MGRSDDDVINRVAIIEGLSNVRSVHQSIGLQRFCEISLILMIQLDIYDTVAASGGSWLLVLETNFMCMRSDTILQYTCI